jgi:hexokinase
LPRIFIPYSLLFNHLRGHTDLGEIVRNILLYLVDNLLLFSGYSSPILNTHYGFDTAFVSAIEAAKSAQEVKSAIFRELNIPENNISEQDVELVQWACQAVSTRAAALSACAVAAVVLHTKALDKSDPIDVGMDGSVAEFLPFFEERVRAALRDTIGQDAEQRVTFGLAKDGSGVGGEPSTRKNRSLILASLTRHAVFDT